MSLALGSGRWALGVGRWALGVGRWALGVGRWALGVGRWALHQVYAFFILTHYFLPPPLYSVFYYGSILVIISIPTQGNNIIFKKRALPPISCIVFS
ncbi:hypothetical protein D8L93_03965 [Sodalis-like symbiont of Bactericera trigonica]|nr:hypothetical protein D8L93_03965 [Sodalis-like symbiont of Bactericera trigonica]